MRRRALRRITLPRAGFVLAVLSASGLGVTLAHAASGQDGASGASPQQHSIQISIKQRRIDFGQGLLVTGQAPSGDQGRRVQLDFERAGSSHWQQISSASVGSRRRFRFHVHPRWSGRVKVTGRAPGAPARSPGPGGTTTTTPTTTGPLPAPDRHSSSRRASSNPRRVAVTAVLHVPQRSIDDLGNHSVGVRGVLLPRAPGRWVHLQARNGSSWHTVSQGRTGQKGQFELHYRPGSSGQLRVHFGGNASNGQAASAAGSVTVFAQGVASWYQDGGNTGCGFHAHYGVANVSLPCGTKVTFIYHNRRVTATVDDRGPYVGGRKWDLNQNTAGALGFAGVDSVWASR